MRSSRADSAPPAMPSKVAVTGVETTRRSGSGKRMARSSKTGNEDAMGQLMAKSFILLPPTR